MFTDLTSFVGALFDMLTAVFDLYTANILLSGVLALWLLRKVVKVFKSL